MAEKQIPDLISDKALCCGCAACYSVCPVAAITMEPDEKGFWYPMIDEQKCIKCQLCMKVCSFKLDSRETMEKKDDE